MKNKQKGFSLIEVLIALVMVSITLMSLLSLQSTLQKMLFDDTLQWKAEQYAFTIFADYQKKENLKPGESFEHAQDQFTAVYSVTAFEQDDPLAVIHDLYREKVLITWTRFLQTYSLSFTRYVYRPSAEKERKETDVTPSPEVSLPPVSA